LIVIPLRVADDSDLFSHIRVQSNCSGAALKKDRERWDQRYLEERGSPFSPDPWLEEHANLLESGRCLDLACGRGGNSMFVADRGYAVHAVDISLAALLELQNEANRRQLDVQCIVMDLDYCSLPVRFYNLVLVFYFFDPRLMNAIEACLKPRGLIVYATYNHKHTSVKPGFNPDYLVPPSGLTPYFPDFQILLNEPYAGESGNLNRMIGRKILE
jgi:tellurite methyltransferase